MNIVSIEGWQALSFFAVDPVPREKGEAWLHNDYLYELLRGEHSLSFSLAPGDRDVRIVLRVRNQKVYELNAMSVLDVKYHTNQDSERIEVVLSKSDSIFLRVNPEIEIDQVFRNEI